MKKLKKMALNPYEDVNWGEVEQRITDYHTHTTYSDGAKDPHEAIDGFHERSYTVLCLADHDTDFYSDNYTILDTYPWEELADIFDTVKDNPHNRYGGTIGDNANEDWEDRDPDSLGMVSVTGVEVSNIRHLISAFNDFLGEATEDPHYAVKEVKDRDGVCFWAHPGRYTDDDPRDTGWYVRFFNLYSPNLCGIEIYNQKNRHPKDVEMWDYLIEYSMPDIPIWAFSVSDVHGWPGATGKSFTIQLVNEDTKEEAQKSIEEGRFFACRRTEDLQGLRWRDVMGTNESWDDVLSSGDTWEDLLGEYERYFPVVESIDDDGGQIKIEARYCDKIQWIADGKVIGGGSSIRYKDNPSINNYVRAELIADFSGETVRIVTQPFGFEKYTEERFILRTGVPEAYPKPFPN